MKQIEQDNHHYHHQRMPTTDFLDLLSPSVPINHHSCQVLSMASSFYTKLMNISLYCSANTGVSMCPTENITYEFIFTLPASLFHLTWIVCGIGGKRPYSCCFEGAISRIYSKQHAASLCISYLVVSLIISLK